MAGKRKPQQREYDLLFIERLYVRGYSHRAIAAELSKERAYTLSHKTIGADIDLILSRWRETMVTEVDKLKAAELARINTLEREAWTEWEESKGTKQRTVSEKRTGERPGTRAQITNEKMLGDPRYLQTVQWCIDKRCKMFGLDAPTKFEGSVAMTLADLVKASREHESGQTGP